MSKCLVKNCLQDVFNKKRRLCKFHYYKYYSLGLEVNNIELETVFYNKIRQNTCWIWSGKVFVFTYNKVKYNPQELSYKLFYKIDPKSSISTNCNNSKCLNPAHIIETGINKKTIGQRFVNIIGKQYSKLTVIGYLGKLKSNNHKYWRCKCECGNIIQTQYTALATGRVHSCGCYRVNRFSVDKYKDIIRLYKKMGYIINTKYTNKLKEVEIITKFGKCIMRIESIKESRLPKISHAVNKNEYFKLKAISIHGNRYNYDLVNYINMYSKVCIICPIHGKFYKIPNEHIGVHKSGCPRCGILKRGNRLKTRVEL